MATLYKNPNILLLILAMTYSALPVLINGFNYPPGDDLLLLERSIKDGLSGERYFGSIPMLIIPAYIYFYMTPLLVAIGQIILLSRHNKWAPLASWIFIFILAWPALNGLRAGSSIPLINFYFLGFITIRLYLSDRYKPLIALALPLLVLFHTSSGIIIATGITVHILFNRRFGYLPAIIPGWIAYILSGVYLHSSARWIIYSLTETENTWMDLRQWALGYASIPLLIILAIILIAILINNKGIHLANSIPIILSISLIAALITLTPIPIDPDRTANILGGLTAVISAILLTTNIPYMKSLLLRKIVVISTCLIILAFGFVTIPFWVGLGAHYA